MHSRGYRQAWGQPEEVLNVGSGNDTRPGWTNMDKYHAADVQHDWLDLPWPFPDASFDGVFLNQVIEHLPPLIGNLDALGVFLSEVERVLRPGGRVAIGVPLAGTPCDVANPTHYRRFNKFSFNFLNPWSHSTAKAMLGIKHLRPIHRGYARGFTLRRGRFHSIRASQRRFGRPINIGPKVGLVFVLLKDKEDHV